jgi:hypothetical protein
MSSNKIVAVIILLVGVVLIVLPFAYDMFDRASAGADMMEAFEGMPYDQELIATLQGHLETFSGMQEDMNKMLPAFAQQMGVTEEQLNQMIGEQFPALAEGMQQMDTMGQDFNNVIAVMGGNVENFQKANELPMRDMPWYFIIAGGIIVVLAGIQLVLPSKS